MSSQQETISRRLHALREEHRDPQTSRPLSQENAARRVGVTMRQWQRWESGASMPYARNLEAIAEAFSFDVSDFFNDHGPDGRPPSLSQLDRIESKLDELLAWVARAGGPGPSDKDEGSLRVELRRARMTPAASVDPTSPQDRRESKS